MRVAVIGAGVVGVTTAYELGADGHDVTVFERHASVAAEASFANAGVVAPGYVQPWAAPGMPGKVVRHLLRAHAPVRLGAALDLSTLRWLWRWWRACRPAVYGANRARMHRLADYSRDRLDELARRLDLEFERGRGFLVLLRTARDLRLAEAGIRALAAGGVGLEVLDADGCRRVEPGLNRATPLHAGVWSKDDQVGNCRQFTHLLRKESEAAGVRFRFRAEVTAIAAGASPRLRLHDGSDADFDAVVVCAALGAAALLRPLGVRLPIQPVYGYSVTAPLRRDDRHLHAEPRGALMDEHHKVAISRLGNRIRVAGGAEIGAVPAHRQAAAQATLDKVLDDWFPGIVQRTQAQRWRGARPMLPDGPPVLGASGAGNVWLNLGHGGSGWALACGSARIVADAVAGRPTPIAIDGLGIERLRA